jgi:endonuclease YncB( thermonuclease family)
MLLLVSACADQVGGPDPSPPVTDLEVRVTSVADGDSFRAEAADGDEVEIRLFGINAPESDECHGAEAGQALDDLIGGRTIGLTVEPELDQFDRVLARAVLGDVYVNLAMVRDGHSLVLGGEGVDRDRLLEAQDQARSADLGLWADNACGAVNPLPTLEIVNIDYNPPGEDDNETVTIANSGAEAVALEGFVLRDESSSNRFEFPAVTIQPGDEITVSRGCGGNVDPGWLEWCTEQPVWNNGGDTALLLDEVGRIVAILRY